MTAVLWIGFLFLVFAMLALDLCVLHREDHVISAREALRWTGFWIAVALSFNVGVYFMYEHHLFGIGHEVGHDLGGSEAALLFLTGYLVEKSLSLDNIFVISVIFNYFHIPLMYQHRTLFWGILGALLLRGLMIAAGAALIEAFSWTVYVFGALLIFTAIKLLVASDEKVEPERNWFVIAAKKFYPVSHALEGNHFFTTIDGKRAMAPLFLVLLVVESTDVLFAVDSIPAIFAVTTDPFLVFTSNVFAILGLRSLYFALASLLHSFKYLKPSLVFLLGYIGVKMLLSHHVKIPIGYSLAMIAGILGIGVAASLYASYKDEVRRERMKDEAEKETPELEQIS